MNKKTRSRIIITIIIIIILILGFITWKKTIGIAQLHQAVLDCNTTQVKLLIALGIDVNEYYNDVPPLARITRNHCIDAEKLLIGAGADVNDDHLLFLLGRDETLDMAELLIESGADINYKLDYFDYYKDMTPLLYATQFRNPKAVKLLIDHGANVNTIHNGKFISSATPLMFTIYTDRMHVETIVDQLIDAGANVNVADNDGNTALHYSIDYNHNHHIHLNVINALIKAGANLNAKNKDGETPLIKALRIAPYRSIYAGDAPDMVKVVQILLDAGADVNITDPNGNTPLHYAIPNLDKIKSLHEACHSDCGSFNYTTSVAFINSLLKAGANINAQSKSGYTPLMNAMTAYENAEIVQTLINAGADVNIADNEGKTALDRCKDADIRELLIKAGAIDHQPATDNTNENL